MISPKKLKENIMEATAYIPAIKSREVVATDDEFVEFLKDHKEADNILLVAVLPAYGGFGEEDEAGTMSFMQFFLLEKVDYKKLKGDDYIAVFERTLAAARDFLSGMFGLGVGCQVDVLQYDFQIRPISRKAGCNGYEIQIDSKAFADTI